MDYKRLLANASQPPEFKKEAHSEPPTKTHLMTYDAIRERATSESASPSDSTKPNRTMEKQKKQAEVKFQEITWKRKPTKRQSQ